MAPGAARVNVDLDPRLDPSVRAARRMVWRWLISDVVGCAWFVFFAAWLAAHRMPWLAAFNLQFGLWAGAEAYADVRRLRRRPL